MLGWLMEKAIDMRVTMATKETKWILEELTAQRRAYVLIRATEFRLSNLREPLLAPFAEIMMSPNNFPPRECYQVYSQLEEMRNQAITSNKRVANQLGAEGVRDLSGFEDTSGKAVENAWRVWMSTIGAAMHASTHANARQVWRLLQNSVDYIPTALRRLSELREVSRGFLSGQVPALDEKEIIREARFVPAFLNGSGTDIIRAKDEDGCLYANSTLDAYEHEFEFNSSENPKPGETVMGLVLHAYLGNDHVQRAHVLAAIDAKDIIGSDERISKLRPTFDYGTLPESFKKLVREKGVLMLSVPCSADVSELSRGDFVAVVTQPSGAPSSSACRWLGTIVKVAEPVLHPVHGWKERVR